LKAKKKKEGEKGPVSPWGVWGGERVEGGLMRGKGGGKELRGKMRKGASMNKGTNKIAKEKVSSCTPIG